MLAPLLQLVKKATDTINSKMDVALSTRASQVSINAISVGWPLKILTFTAGGGWGTTAASESFTYNGRGILLRANVNARWTLTGQMRVGFAIDGTHTPLGEDIAAETFGSGPYHYHDYQGRVSLTPANVPTYLYQFNTSLVTTLHWRSGGGSGGNAPIARVFIIEL